MQIQVIRVEIAQIRGLAQVIRVEILSRILHRKTSSLHQTVLCQDQEMQQKIRQEQVQKMLMAGTVKRLQMKK